MEKWKDVVGYEGIYQVSDLGRVKRVKKTKGATEGKILKNLLNKRKDNSEGYYYASLWRNGREHRITVHRLVALAFIPNPKNKPEINHKNGIKAFNRPENLEWVTKSENALHARRVLGVGAGENNYRAKLKNSDIPLIRQLLNEGNLTQTAIGKMFGVAYAVIKNVKRNRTYRCVD